jgi:adenosine kinase
MFKHVIVSGSLAFDRIMDFPGKFSDHILPDKIHILNVCFAINGLRENFGGTAGNIAYALSLLGERPHVVATAGRDFGPYRTWMIAHHLPLEHITELADELTAGAYITTDQSDPAKPSRSSRPATSRTWSIWRAPGASAGSRTSSTRASRSRPGAARSCSR